MLRGLQVQHIRFLAIGSKGMDHQIWMMLELLPRLNLVLLKSVTVILFSLPLGLGGIGFSMRWTF